ncbi:hypothetical protein HYH02_011818 [Chlamydomonas schloesseri]|uniref:Uncharacterized protein n=1 Tax=Chlamydomonas schloesseri TaxID=2026947 RepID=A0A835W3B4_9CHLO|nr:hypothetical protein HYH02_011818 [Chlamydomonas schloesseri]|eukprot:KAG2435524.1 hypothetical protein HYH02_011818 [Chlamydomonas schloesseri]
MDPATMAAAIQAGQVVFKERQEGCCTSPWFRASCTGSGVAECKKCHFYYCKYHYPVNNGGLQGGHNCN